MYIERLELFGYRRLALGGIQRLVYTPTAPQQLILGTNGSGKSSILYELSPVPAHSSHYTKDGYKIIELTHRGRRYILSTTFKNGNKNSFICDDEELNPGGTSTAQRDLVKQHFDMTLDLHKLLIGKTRFTEMSQQDRRKWITMLSTADYTYALGVFDRTRVRLRDTQGASKHLKQRLTQETNALNALGDTTGLEERAEQLRTELNVLLRSIVPDVPHHERLLQQLDPMLERMGQLARRVIEARPYQPMDGSYTSIAQVQEDVARQEAQTQMTQQMLERVTGEYSEIESIVLSFETAEGEITPENIEGHLLSVDEEINQLLSGVRVFNDLDDALAIRRDNVAVLDEVMQLFKELPDNSERIYSRERAQQSRDEMRALMGDIDKANAQMSKIRVELQHMHEAHANECPSCHYVWRPGFSEHEVEKLQGFLTQHGEIVTKAETRIATLRAYLEEADAVTVQYGQFRGFINGYPRLKPLWDYILQHNYLTDKPRERLALFTDWQRDVEIGVKLQDQYARQRQLKEIADRQSKMEGSGHFNMRLHRLSEEIETITANLLQQRQSVRSVRGFHDRLTRADALLKELEQEQAAAARHQGLTINALRNHHLQTVVSTHQNELAMVQHRLTERSNVENIVKDLAFSHGEVELHELALSLITKELSPKEGLIAEQLTGFIEVLTSQLNSILSSIWTYGLVVQPCGLDNAKGELDYRFPLQIEAGDNVVYDVSEGSTAQQEVIDFAFKLTVMLYLGLKDYPLFIDELGAGFDEQHRSNAMSFVKQLMDIDNHSQLFMVSHYATNHGSFTSAQVFVVNGSNVAVPVEHNQHVVLE